VNVIVTGATGFIGRPLCARLLAEGHAVTALSRDADRARETLGPNVRCLSWLAPRALADDSAWRDAIARADAVFNLAGESVAKKRWTPAIKKALRTSRVDAARAVGGALAERDPAAPPATLLNASAVGYYGPRGDESLSEDSPPGSDFMAALCQAWEAESQRACHTRPAPRVVLLRIGVAFGPGEDGLLHRILYPLPGSRVSPWTLGLGGPLGTGKQWLPWVHIQDVVGLLVWAMTNPNVHGPLNVVAPDAVTNAQLARAIGRVLSRPAVLPVPAPAVRLLAGEVAEAVLVSQRVRPQKALDLGYRFRFTDIDAALRDLLPRLTASL